MSQEFTKMTGAGNDFVLFDHRGGGAALSPESVRRLCDRRFGVGADGVLVLTAAEQPGVTCRMRYYNADGSEGEMCGNGARCVAYFLADETPQALGAQHFQIQSTAGLLEAEATPGMQGARVRLTPPQELRLNQRITAGGRRLTVHFINTGVPHVVLWGARLEEAHVDSLGRAIRQHAAFAPAGANVNFAKLDAAAGQIHLRTYERGVEAETLACGTGATAAALIGHALYGLANPAAVRVRSGDVLRIHFQAAAPGKYQDVWLEGPARKVFAGRLAPGVL